jgi:hypothetical protein
VFVQHALGNKECTQLHLSLYITCVCIIMTFDEMCAHSAGGSDIKGKSKQMEERDWRTRF